MYIDIKLLGLNGADDYTAGFSGMEAFDWHLVLNRNSFSIQTLWLTWKCWPSSVFLPYILIV